MAHIWPPLWWCMGCLKGVLAAVRVVVLRVVGIGFQLVGSCSGFQLLGFQLVGSSLRFPVGRVPAGRIPGGRVCGLVRKSLSWLMGFAASFNARFKCELLGCLVQRSLLYEPQFLFWL